MSNLEQNNKYMIMLRDLVDRHGMGTDEFKAACLDIPTAKSGLDSLVTWDKIHEITGWRPQ